MKICSFRQKAIMQKVALEAREPENEHTTELGYALAQIEKLQAEVIGLKSALKAEQLNSLNSEKLSRHSWSHDVLVSAKGKKSYEHELNRLHVELTEAQIAKADLESQHESLLADYEADIAALTAEADDKLDEKDAEINELKNRLGEREDEAKRHSQIFSTLNGSFNRRGEMEDLQEEVIALNTKNSVLNRQLQSLKLQLDEVQAEKQRLEERLEDCTLEIEEKQLSRGSLSSRRQMQALKEENAKLRESIQKLSMERRRLQDRLDSRISLQNDNSKTTEVFRERNLALRKEVETLNKRLKRMEKSVTRCAI